MRSRYSAFALGDEEYLRETWHPGTVPDGDILDPSTRWLGLEIVDSPVAEGKKGVVEFIARYRDSKEHGELRERSRFVFQSERWWYLDGTHASGGTIGE